MRFIADLHIHSKYSRATSPKTDLEHLSESAKIKGVRVLGTGDFTHPVWLKEMQAKLVKAEDGLFKLKDNDNGTRFILSSEISCIYKKNDRVRKIHILTLAPSFEAVEKINAKLNTIGNLKSDGRPILGLDAKELAKIIFEASADCVVIPAHCLLPDTYIQTKIGIEKIQNIKVGDFVYTHKGRVRKVEKIYSRPYRGEVFNIQPFYFGLGIKVTPEHPFYAIKSQKYCPTMGCKTTCKQNCASQNQEKCPHKYFKNYKSQWIQAKDLERGDILIFPRLNNIKNIETVKVTDYLTKKDYRVEGDFIRCDSGMRANLVPSILKINKDFCRLIGYYLSEGYTDNRDSVSFCFSSTEKAYVEDVKNLMKNVFNLSYCREIKRDGRNSIELIFFSKILSKFFGKVFYSSILIRRANTKCLPTWALNLSLDKQAEILKGWWRGDAGSTVSRILMNQMKVVCLRLGIIPSIRISEASNFNKAEHQIGTRKITANHDTFYFSNLSFFKDEFELLKDDCFKKFSTKLKRRHGWIDEKYIYIPVRSIKKNHYQGEVYNLEVKEDNSYLSEFVAVHNCWTPWFSLFGSKSGFNKIEDCFEELTGQIFALETGLSSDPQMNWQLSALDRFSLVSNSDCHSPEKIGREANVFDTELSYFAIKEALQKKDKDKFLFTIEFFPEEGKYHYDGHRVCNISFSPEQTKKHNGICPACKKLLVVGVSNRVAELADKPFGFQPKNAIPYKSLVPLRELIGEVLGVGSSSKKVDIEYQKLIRNCGCELEILLEMPIEKLKEKTLADIAKAIDLMRQGKVQATPGYDGVYGKIKVLGELGKNNKAVQPKLFDNDF